MTAARPAGRRGDEVRAAWDRARSSALSRDVEAISVTEPTQNEVLVKAKQIAHDDGKLIDKAGRWRLRADVMRALSQGIHVPAV
jgi:hypothetical protein